MKCSCGVSLSSLLAVVGVFGLGVAGFNIVKTGCPLGSCSAAANAGVLPASTNSAPCPASGGCHDSAPGGQDQACPGACTHEGECTGNCPRGPRGKVEASQIAL